MIQHLFLTDSLVQIENVKAKSLRSKRNKTIKQHLMTYQTRLSSKQTSTGENERITIDIRICAIVSSSILTGNYFTFDLKKKESIEQLDSICLENDNERNQIL